MSKSSFTVIYRNKIFTRNFKHNKQKMFLVTDIGSFVESAKKINKGTPMFN